MKSPEPEPILRDSDIWRLVVLLVAGVVLAGALLWLIGCGPLPGPKPPAPPQPPAVFCAAPSVHVGTNDGPPVVGARASIGGVSGSTNADGYVYLGNVPAGQQTLDVTADGFLPYAGVYQIDSWSCDMPVALQSLHVDPSTIPLAELARIQGAMWPRTSVCPEPLRLPLGPRPNQPDNIIATPYFDNYTGIQQEAIARCFQAVGWTNVVVGGLVDDWAYHGQYIGHDYSSPDAFEHFLDQLAWFWDHELRPVVFIHQDGATYEQTEAMVDRLITNNARAQRLIRIVVMSGWEPGKYEISSCTWAKYVALARRALPNALVLLHTVSDVDAPAGTDALCNDDDKGWNPDGNGGAWRRVIAAGLDGWLIQNGPYTGGPPDDPTLARNFSGQFLTNGVGADTHGAAWHFAHAIGGWPTSSRWGAGVPICLYAAEQTAYKAYWENRPSDAARNAWGDLAVRSGACGYLDGGTVDVPRRR